MKTKYTTQHTKKEVVNYWQFSFILLNIWNTFAFLALFLYNFINEDFILAFINISCSLIYMFISSRVIYDLMTKRIIIK